MQQDLFTSLFEQSNHLEISLEITPQEASYGSRRVITFQSNTICPMCQSQGVVEGFFKPKRCETCKGEGIVACQRQFQVTTPAGARNGTRLQFPGEGLLGLFGAARGNLYITIQVQADPFPQRPIAPQMPTMRQPGGFPPPVAPHPAFSQPNFPNQPTVAGPPTRAGQPGNPLINTTLGNYHLQQLLGTGGFADVYLGQHRYLNTYAAVKVMKEQMAGQNVQGFIREAQTIAALKHPNIIRILDFGVEGSIPYLVMDYAPGGTLRDRHPEGTTLPLAAILPYVKQVATALQYAHDQRIIHRDIKPANMLVEDYSVILSDFGIAVAAHRTRSINLHQQEAVGTVSYMAPEQINGKPRPASDQYSLAIVIYEWLCGECPFDGNSAVEIAMHHISTSPPSLHAKIPMISPSVERVIFRALAKDPAQRFDSIQAFANALEAVGSR